MDRDAALRALTINPARLMGVADRIGSIEPGKDADLAIWSGDPLDVYSRVTHALINGTQIYAHNDGAPVYG
jgi:imidazolonepropionase-like amidohydrolase